MLFQQQKSTDNFLTSMLKYVDGTPLNQHSEAILLSTTMQVYMRTQETMQLKQSTFYLLFRENKA